MPQLPQVFNAYPMNVTLDSNGNGAIQFQAVGCNARITNRSIRTSTAVKQAIASTYLGQIGDNYRIDATNSGSTGDNVTSAIELRDGESLYVVWTGGDAGATAYATFSGVTLPFDKLGGIDTGKGWNNPIAAGDGTLIYPALKSPNFITNISGWSLNRNGDVELNNATIRGSVTAGSGTVILNTNGVRVDGTDRTYQINKTVGFLARRIPDDGAYSYLAQVSPNPPVSPILFMQPTNPSPINSHTIANAMMFATVDNNAGVESPVLFMQSPLISGQAASGIRFSGSDTNNANRRIDLVTNSVTVDGTDIGKGTYIFDTTQGSTAASSATTDTIVQTATAPSGFSASRRYRITFAGTVGGTVATDRIGFRIYVGATLLVDFGQITLSAASVSQPYIFTMGLTGVPGQNVTLQARRVAGTGTWTVGYKYVELTDVSPL